MRRLIIIGLLVLGAAVVLYGNWAYAQPQCSVRVILTSIGQVYNDHVGNDWSFSTSVNDGPWVAVSGYVVKTVSQQDSVASGSSFKITAKAIEDDKYPDIGINSKSIQVQCPFSGEARQSLSIDVTVTENRGRYAGHSAMWGFEFEIISVTSKPESPESRPHPESPPPPPRIIVGLSLPTIGTVEYDTSGRIVATRGLNFLLGVSYRRYFRSLHSGLNFFWGSGTIILIIPYWEFGLDYAIPLGYKQFMSIDLYFLYVIPLLGITFVF